jgi:RNA polymerase sigma-70 factor (ECF subfamily)
VSTSTRYTSQEAAPAGEDIPRRAFVTTHWSVVLSARDKASPQAAEALEKLCRAYWYPLYAHVRWLGYSPHDAEDLTQEFFVRLLRNDVLDAVERERGRFRSFLLMALKRFVSDEWDRARAQKRGGGLRPVPLDAVEAECRYQSEPAQLPADRMYERRWALTLLAQTMARLRAEFERAGHGDDFERLKRFLTSDKREIPYAEAARELNMGEGALRVAVHRLRKRFRELFREEIAHTVARAEDVEEEFRHLLAALS